MSTIRKEWKGHLPAAEVGTEDKQRRRWTLTVDFKGPNCGRAFFVKSRKKKGVNFEKDMRHE